MAMTREAFVTHTENKHFSAILAEMNQANSELDRDRFVHWFRDAFLTTSNPDSWFELLSYLGRNKQSVFKIPDDLLSTFNLIIEHENAKLKDNTARCSQLFKRVLDELAATTSINLMGNELPSFEYSLIANDTHSLLLNLIAGMNEDDQQQMYKYLLDLYIDRPYLLYQASCFNHDIFNNLSKVKTDENKKWFLDTIEPIFKSGDRDRISKIFTFIRNTENNNINFKINSKEEFINIIKLKKIATQSDTVINKLRAELKDDKNALSKLEALATNKNELDILDFTNTMTNFMDGYGNIAINEALLTCAQIANRKKYEFNPVVLEGYNEFVKLLNIVKNSAQPCKIKFLITSTHCVSGEIEMTADGHAKLAVYDSLGVTKKKSQYFLQFSTLDLMEMFNKVFPSDPIYFCPVKRQKAPKGCSVYGLSDLVYLFTREDRLHTNIFDYYEKQPKPVKEMEISGTENLNIKICDMPLSLLRNTQSRTTIDEIVQRTSEAILNTPVNKKGDKFIPQVNSFFQSTSATYDKKQNVRLDYELKKIAKPTAVYLLTHNKATIEHDKDQFRLPSFEKRITKTSKKGFSAD